MKRSDATTTTPSFPATLPPAASSTCISFRTSPFTENISPGDGPADIKTHNPLLHNLPPILTATSATPTSSRSSFSPLPSPAKSNPIPNPPPLPPPQFHKTQPLFKPRLPLAAPSQTLPRIRLVSSRNLPLPLRPRLPILFCGRPAPRC